MAKIYRNKAGKKLYPVCKWEDNQHKIYNAHDRIMIRIYEAQENGGEDLEALYKEQERIEKALELIDACVIDGLVYATYEDGLILKDLIWAYNARHKGGNEMSIHGVNARQLQIISILKEAKCTNTAELQEELGVSRRTLRTDIAYLKRVYPDKLITHRGRYTGGLEWVE